MAAQLTPETTEDEFKEFVRDSSDANLAALMNDEELRPQLVARIFEIWCAAVLEPKTEKTDATIHWQIGDEPDRWTMHVYRGTCTATPGRSEKRADVTFTLGDVAFLRLVAREVSGVQLLATGKLRLKGNMLTAMRIDSWFD
ncbi:SCP2 sterol-binding domain-containing protein [Nocardia brasiliensis]|uniref:SCP2 sterol-binding domain-containing protein n=1 Tax=Nocardia brasiliensis TaxID=37326 RepID=UPI001895EF16|nr:SCP2 sterol-binding domain-containing protein [Nocardia brasiliensis]MBF6130868.1 SCP2 sterol-binding domain-containing protein [Nocardia brasiliensis]